MSGEKRTRVVNVSDLERWQRQAANYQRALADNQELMNTIAALERSHDDRVRGLNNKINSLNTALQKQSTAMTKERQEMRDAMNQTIRNMNAALIAQQQQSDAKLRNVATKLNEKIEGVDERVTALHKVVATVEERVDNIETKINAVTASDGVLLEYAKEYAEQTEIIMRDMLENFRVDLLCPGKREVVEGLMRVADGDIDLCDSLPTNASVARAHARQAYVEAIQLREEVISAEAEWQAHFRAAQMAVETAEKQCEQCENVTIEATLKGEKAPVKFDVDTDKWSAGEFSELREYIGDARKELENSNESTVQRLDEITDAANQAREEVIEVTGFAMSAFDSSGKRNIQVARMARELVQNYGCSLVDHGYEGDDQRSGYRVGLRNKITGLEVVISGDPTMEEGHLVNEFGVDVINYGNLDADSRVKLRKRICELLQLGRGDAVIESAPTDADGTSRRKERAKIGQYKKQKPASLPRKPKRPTGTKKPQRKLATSR